MEQKIRTEKKHKKLLPPAILIFAAALFIVVCAYASNCATIYPHTFALGINVGHMTMAEADKAISDAVPEIYGSKTITVIGANEHKAVIDLGAIDIKVNSGGEAAYACGRRGGFFGSGISYLRAAILSQTADISITYDKAPVEKMLAAADESSAKSTYKIEDDVLLITKGTSGKSIDRDPFYAAFDKALQQRDFSDFVCATVSGESDSLAETKRIHDAVYTPCRNAYYDTAANTVAQGERGIDFNPDDAQKIFDAAKEGQEFKVPLTITQPTITKETLSKKLFTDTLGQYTTAVSGSTARRNNVKLATAALNGTILNAGDVFSYNETVGQRTKAKGYQAAPAYVSGLTVNEIGGGVCQVSSTLYLATLYSNLETTYRVAHRYRASYTPFGMDATVSFPSPDFRFTNNTDYPIKVLAEYTGNNLCVKIIGTKTDTNIVKMEYQILSVTPYKTLEQSSEALDYGTRKQTQSGYTGYEVVTYRCIYSEDGKLLSRTKAASSNYKSRDAIVLVGAKKETLPKKEAETPAPPPDETTTDPAQNTTAPVENAQENTGETLQEGANTGNSDSTPTENQEETGENNKIE